ncbi:hypothetical protein FZEAL_9209 [Fusarium zealandicum]|uniref:BTB domain-containing protein n=1 Tax=Fusarium zealandicum TaxID=1053134 RepID=A0A8H4UCE7_9HYPO|nr:hypothetical protein FZEAL_9209 [Fusarium zealandicum]
MIILPEQPAPTKDQAPTEDEEPMDLSPSEDEEPMDLSPTEDEEPTGLKTETKFRVSSKHLTMASRRAKVMFSGNFAESQPNEDGFRHWKFEPIFESSAFEIVMNAIHGHTQKLPTSVTIKTLAQIAAVVDDLECHNALWFPAKMWIDTLKDSLSRAHDSALAGLILVSFVFSEPELFKSATRKAIREGTKPFPSYGLPIRPKIIETMDEDREFAIESFVLELESITKQICQYTTTCIPECKPLVIGAFMQKIVSMKLSTPQPVRPFPGFSCSNIDLSTRQFQLPLLYLGTNLQSRSGFEMPKEASVILKERPRGNDLPSHRMEGKLEEHTCDLRNLTLSGIKPTFKNQGLELSKFR